VRRVAVAEAGKTEGVASKYGHAREQKSERQARMRAPETRRRAAVARRYSGVTRIEAVLFTTRTRVYHA